MQVRSLVTGAGSAAMLTAVFLGIHNDPLTNAAFSLIAGLLATASGSIVVFVTGFLVMVNIALISNTSALTGITIFIIPYLAPVAAVTKLWKTPFTIRRRWNKRDIMASALTCLGASLIVLGSAYIAGADRIYTLIPSYDSLKQLLLVLMLSLIVGASLGHSSFAVFLAGLAVPLFLPISVLLVSAGSREHVTTYKGGALIGEVVGVIEGGALKESKGKVFLDFSEAGNHTVVVGATGAGKSRLIKRIAEELRMMNYGIVLIDTHGEHSDIGQSTVLAPKDVRLNLASGGKQEIDDITDIISEAFRLGPLQRAVLHEAMTRVYERGGDVLSLKDVISELSSEQPSPVNRSLISYLSSLSKYFSDEGVNVHELLRPGTIHIIDISGLGHTAARVFVDILLRSIIYSAMRNATKAAVIVEEAHRFAGGRATALGRLFREGRKFGITAAITTQSPTDLSGVVYVNSRYIISFAVTDARGAGYLAQTISGGSRETYVSVRKVLSRLKKGEALVWDREGDRIYVVKTF